MRRPAYLGQLDQAEVEALTAMLLVLAGRPEDALPLSSRAIDRPDREGGQSGEPAITPGYADDSPLIQYVMGRIEDLEMPPLDKREKYPALSDAEIDLLRAWIDDGAPWPAGETIEVSASAR